MYGKQQLCDENIQLMQRKHPYSACIMLSSIETCLNQDCVTIINGWIHAHIYHDLSPREMKEVLDAGSLIAKISLLISLPLYLTTTAGDCAVIGLCKCGWWIRQLKMANEVSPMLAVVL